MWKQQDYVKMRCLKVPLCVTKAPDCMWKEQDSTVQYIRYKKALPGNTDLRNLSSWLDVKGAGLYTV
jgi:hypothetical protein